MIGTIFYTRIDQNVDSFVGHDGGGGDVANIDDAWPKSCLEESRLLLISEQQQHQISQDGRFE